MQKEIDVYWEFHCKILKNFFVEVFHNVFQDIKNVSTFGLDTFNSLKSNCSKENNYINNFIWEIRNDLDIAFRVEVKIPNILGFDFSNYLFSNSNFLFKKDKFVLRNSTYSYFLSLVEFREIFFYIEVSDFTLQQNLDYNQIKYFFQKALGNLPYKKSDFHIEYSLEMKFVI